MANELLCGTTDLQVASAFSILNRWPQRFLPLGWTLGATYAGLPREPQKQAIRDALRLWSDAANIDFKELPDGSPDALLKFSFEPKDHGDYAFDENHLAHAYFPSENPVTDPLSGDTHYYNKWPWAIERAPSKQSILSVGIHEIGHAVGIGHSNDPKSVMYPYDQGFRALAEDDIKAVQELYGERVAPRTQRWQKNPITWTVKSFWPDPHGELLNATQLEYVRRGIEFWSTVCGLQFNYVQNGADIEVIFETMHLDNPPYPAAYGGPDVSAPDGTILHAQIHMNNEIPWGEQGIVQAILHEAGHCHGFDHPTIYVASIPGWVDATAVDVKTVYGPPREYGMNITDTILAHPNNYNTTGRTGYNKVFIHSTRSGVAGRTDLELELLSTVNWFQNPNAQASTHLVASPNQLVRTVHETNVAYHVGEDNADSLGIELTQPEVYTPYPDALLQRAAEAVASWCDTYGIPKVHLTSYVPGQKGIIGHEDGRHGRRVGKSDPGPVFPWDRFIAMVNGEQGDDDMSAENNAFVDKLKANMPGGEWPTYRELWQRLADVEGKSHDQFHNHDPAGTHDHEHTHQAGVAIGKNKPL